MAAKKPDPGKLMADLAAGKIAILTVEQWHELASRFSEVSRTPTGMGAAILLVRRPVPGRKTPGWAIVEESKPGERVIRPLPSRKAAMTLIGERLAAYERMWDG